MPTVGPGLTAKLSGMIEAAGGGHADDLERVLDRHRQAVQRAEPAPARQRRVGARGLRQRAFLVERDDGVDRGTDLAHAVEVQLQQLDGADLARMQARQHFGRGLEGERQFARHGARHWPSTSSSCGRNCDL